MDIFARRLQIQERLTMQIKDCIQETARSVRRDGRDRGTTYVYADAWCREAKLPDDNLGFHRILPTGQNARRIYESDQT